MQAAEDDGPRKARFRGRRNLKSLGALRAKGIRRMESPITKAGSRRLKDVA